MATAIRTGDAVAQATPNVTTRHAGYLFHPVIDFILAGGGSMLLALPIILLIHEPNPGFVREAARRGIFAYITDGESDDDSHEWQSSIDIVLRRFTEYHDLQGAFGRRAVIERAKGILMERHSVDEDDSFELLRSHARTSNRKLVDVATAVVDGHALLPKAVG